MHKCKSFKIIASRLKRCSSWCCHVYIATNTSASKCLKWPNEMKYGIVASLIKFQQFKGGFTTKWAHSKYRQRDQPCATHVCKVNYPKQSSHIMSWDKLVIWSNFQSIEFYRSYAAYHQSLSNKCVWEVINAIKTWLIDHVKPMPKAIRILRQWSRYPLQSSSSPLSAIRSCLDTLTWDSKDPSRSFHILFFKF
jgi:hypothetical protein